MQGYGALSIWGRGASMLALATAASLAWAGGALAQAAPDQGNAANEGDSEIVVTGSRIERAGFDQPTPTTVIGTTELRQGARPNLQQVLNDSPQFRPTTTPQVSVGNTSSGNAPVDLRGLGAARTLTLLNGRRFVGNNNLNYLPLNMIERVEVVTGGASAAYGSDAVAGVVNIILKDKLEGLSIGGLTGISSRGDGMRYGADLSYGTSFAGGGGHAIFGAEYVNDKSIPDRNSRRNLGSAQIVRINPLSTTDQRTMLVRDVNFGDRASAGLITSGILAGQVFNEDGTLRAFRGGTLVPSSANPTSRFPAQMIGGEDGVGTYDAIAVTTPVERISAFGQLSYDLGGVRVWAQGSYGRSASSYGLLADSGVAATTTIQATNPFLSPAIRAQLAAAGETSFTLGKFYDGAFELGYQGVREQKEGAIGIDGDIGRWKFNAHYSHGQVDFRPYVTNARVVSRYNAAINAVSSGGQIVCAINADANPANDDPACRPLNLFGRYGASTEALDYVMDTQRTHIRTKLDAMAAQIQGDLFSLWAGPITVVVGAEARFEEQVQESGTLDRAGAFGPLNLYGNPVNGGFNVKEGFGEIAVPLLDVEGTAKIDLNGAARYSDYSRSGGIWSWKAGGTARLFDTLTLRATRSRDIRAPSITDLFSVRSIGIGSVNDQDFVGRQGVIPGYIQAPAQVTSYSGGNPDLKPEISKTITFGAAFTPSFIRGFNLSVDYYNIRIAGAIATLSPSNLTLACRNGSTAACDRITRDPTTQTVIEVRSNAQNIASFQNKGFDFEASYVLPMNAIAQDMSGSLRIRALATYVKTFIFDTGVARVDTAGDVNAANSTPKWRGTLSLNYQGESIGLDARVRYVGGGLYDHLNVNLVNNKVKSRTYLDLGAQFRIAGKFTLFGNVNNVFDRAPPISTGGPIFYDAVGTYFSGGVRVNF